MFIKPFYKVCIFFSNSNFVFPIIGFIKFFYIFYLIERTTFFSYNVYTS
nr:MAG TPA: hypothetical protein [Caudoviricetes sp.]